MGYRVQMSGIGSGEERREFRVQCLGLDVEKEGIEGMQMSGMGSGEERNSGFRCLALEKGALCSQSWILWSTNKSTGRTIIEN